MLVREPGLEPIRVAGNDARLHASFVVDTGRYEEGELATVDVETGKHERWGREKLDDVEDRAETLGIEHVTHLCVGDPHAEIISYADDIDADLIVLGYQGHTHQDTDYIGSVTDRVVPCSSSERRIRAVTSAGEK